MHGTCPACFVIWRAAKADASFCVCTSTSAASQRLCGTEKKGESTTYELKVPPGINPRVNPIYIYMYIYYIYIYIYIYMTCITSAASQRLCRTKRNNT